MNEYQALICWNCDKNRIWNKRTHLCKPCTDLIEKKNFEDQITLGKEMEWEHA